uniref:Uncharacterized protein n=1 Tax=Rhizophora mucronata TaxID=61149 RepID=A0A2P2N8H1_RHIMU
MYSDFFEAVLSLRMISMVFPTYDTS